MKQIYEITNSNETNIFLCIHTLQTEKLAL